MLAALVTWLLLAALGAPAARAQVVNGGFESPAVAGVAEVQTPGTFGGWAVDAGTVRFGATPEWIPASGLQSAWLDGTSAAQSGFSQVVAVQPGGRYRLRFRFSDGPLAPPGGYVACGAIAGKVMPLQVFWGDTKVAELQQSGHLSDDWQEFGTLVVATNAATTLRFLSARVGIADCGMTLDDVELGTPAADETAVSLTGPAESFAGAPAVFTASVIAGDPGAVPTGSVQFTLDGAPSGDAIPLDGTGKATLTTTGLDIGSHVVGASYTPSPAGSFQPSSAPVFGHEVVKGKTETELVIAPEPSVAGQPVTFTATVAPQAPSSGVPTGHVVFSDADGTTIGEAVELQDGAAELVVSSDAGEYSVRADYVGSERFERSSATQRQTVERAATVTTLESSVNPVATGAELTLDIVVSTVEPGDVYPGGSVVIAVDGHDVGTAPIFALSPIEAGVVATLRAPAVAGSATITARYTGDVNTAPSVSSPLVQQVVALAAPPARPPDPAPAAPPTAAPAPPSAVPALTALNDRLARALRANGPRALRRAQKVTVPAAGLLAQRVFSLRRRGRARRKLLASANRTFAAAGDGTLELRLTRAGRRALRRTALRLEIVSSFRQQDGRSETVRERVRAGAPSAARATWALAGTAPPASAGQSAA